MFHARRRNWGGLQISERTIKTKSADADEGYRLWFLSKAAKAFNFLDVCATGC